MRRGWLRAAGLVAVWLVTALVLWPVLFTHSSARTVVASHDAVLHPTLDGQVRLDLGPYLPDVRFASHHRIGVFVEVGKTTATSGAELAQRYASIAAHPDAEVDRVTSHLTRLALDAALRAALLALVPIGLWLLLGQRRRAELVRVRPRVLGATAALLAVGVVLLVQPWQADEDRVQPQTWVPIGDALPDLTVPTELRKWQLEGGLVTSRDPAARAERLRHLRQSARSSTPTSSTGSTPCQATAAPARRGRDRGAAGQRPSRQHRHGRRGARPR